MRRRRGGLIRGVARTAVVVGTASAVAGGVQHHQAAEVRRAGRAGPAGGRRSGLPAADGRDAGTAGRSCHASAAAPAGTPDLTAQLMQLGQLKSQGILSERGVPGREGQAARLTDRGGLRGPPRLHILENELPAARSLLGRSAPCPPPQAAGTLAAARAGLAALGVMTHQGVQSVELLSAAELGRPGDHRASWPAASLPASRRA